MRLATSLFLTSLILLNLFGFYAVFMVQQQEIREEMSEAVKVKRAADSQVFHLTLTQLARLNWTVAGKEFTMNGHLYDVIGLKQSGNRIELTAASDACETELVSNFLSLFSQQQEKDQSSSPLKTFISHFQQDYVTASQRFFHLAPTEVRSGFMIKQVYPCPSFIADNLTPPPQFFLA